MSWRVFTTYWAWRTTDAKLRKTTTSQSLEAIFPLVETVACAATPCTPERPQLTGYAFARRLVYYTASPIEGSTIALIPGRVRRMTATFQQGVNIDLHGFLDFARAENENPTGPDIQIVLGRPLDIALRILYM